MPALTRNKNKGPKSQTPPSKKVTKAQAPTLSKNQAKTQKPPLKTAEKPQTLTLKKGAKSQKKPPLKKQKKDVVEEAPLESDEELSDGSDDLESGEELGESDDGEEGPNGLGSSGFFSDDDDDGEENDEELLDDNFLEGSGDEEEPSDLDAASSSDSDSDSGDILKQSDAIDREDAKRQAEADAEMLDFNKEVGPDEDSEFAFRLPTEEVQKISCAVLCFYIGFFAYAFVGTRRYQILISGCFMIFISVQALECFLAISNCCYYLSLSRNLKKKHVGHQIFLYCRVGLKRVCSITNFISLLLLNTGVLLQIIQVLSCNGQFF